MNPAFKEWQVVCDALARGEQSIILRKGGIAEGREGFQFQHEAFWLFPTLFHAQAERIRPEFRDRYAIPAAGPDAERETVSVDLFARIAFHRILTGWDEVASLEPFHIWTEEEIRNRFVWSKDKDAEPGISLACVRVYRLAEPWVIANEKRYGGCRSWIDLPDHDPATRDKTAVLDDAAFEKIVDPLAASNISSIGTR